jgi:hypothetical protein
MIVVIGLGKDDIYLSYLQRKVQVGQHHSSRLCIGFVLRLWIGGYGEAYDSAIA